MSKLWCKDEKLFVKYFDKWKFNYSQWRDEILTDTRILLTWESLYKYFLLNPMAANSGIVPKCLLSIFQFEEWFRLIRMACKNNQMKKVKYCWKWLTTSLLSSSWKRTFILNLKLACENWWWLQVLIHPLVLVCLQVLAHPQVLNYFQVLCRTFSQQLFLQFLSMLLFALIPQQTTVFITLSSIENFKWYKTSLLNAQSIIYI